ncbi:MAG: hypothetical protein PGMFKBFP_00941 [Anaerolineales bacterium]|nr:hypothetical protein [Anaerolineales bacterium]
MIERVEGVRQIVRVRRHHQRTVLVRGLLHRRREFRELLDQFDLVLRQLIIEGASRGPRLVSRRLRLLQNAVGSHVRVLDVRSRAPVERERRVHVEDDVLVVVHREHGIGQRAQPDLLGDLPPLGVAHLGSLLRFHRQHAPHGFVRHVFEQRHASAPRRHGSLGQADETVAEVIALLRLRKAPQSQDRERLLQMQRLAHVHHINGTVHVILLEFHFRQRDVLRQVKRGPVRAQDDVRAVLFLFETEFLVNLHDDRAALRTFVVGDASGDQLLHDGFGRSVYFALEEPHVYFHVQHAQDLAQFLQTPLARHAPEFAHVRIARVVLAIHLAALGLILLAERGLFGRFVFLFLQPRRGLDVNFQQPLSALVHARGFLPFIKPVVSPHHRDDAQAQVAGIRGADRLEARELRQPRQRLAQDGVAIMSNVERVMRVRLGVLDHDPLPPGRAPPKVRAGGEDGIHHPPRVIGRLEIDVKVALHRVHAADSLHASHLTSNLLGQLLRPRRDGFPRAPRARLVRRGLEKRSGDAPLAAVRDRRPLERRERNPLRRAVGADLCLDDVLNIVEHGRDYNIRLSRDLRERLLQAVDFVHRVVVRRADAHHPARGLHAETFRHRQRVVVAVPDVEAFPA